MLPDGQKFGPADLRLLNQWAAEGRILHGTVLEEASTGRRFDASSLPGLALPQTQTPPTMMSPGTIHPPQQYAPYYRGGPGSVVGDNGQNDLTLSYVFSAIGLATCFGGGLCGGCSLIGIVFPILGLVYANKAEQKGHPSAGSAKILGWVALCLQIVSVILSFALLGASMMGGI